MCAISDKTTVAACVYLCWGNLRHAPVS